uniref:Group XV phospholipase A2-like n=1 Tax=Tetracapsuloides bryosalmonae TaxID=271932 RepID=A0A859IQE0_9CNID|nr:group XV phospholipase A2-like [Tetracapsuloides bryosalmonae]
MEFDKFQKKLHYFIESMSEKFNSSVIVITHSMGGTLFNKFQSLMTDEWLNKFIYKWVSLSAPLGGAIDSIRTVLTGNDFGIPKLLFDAGKFVDFLRTFPSVYYLFPDFDVFNSSEVFLELNNQSFTLRDWRKIVAMAFPQYEDFSFNSLKIYQNEAPRVKMLCIISKDVPTPRFFTYNSLKFQPNIVYEDGDGTVDFESLNVCDRYQKQASNRIRTFLLKRINHLNILHSPLMLDILEKELYL